MTASHHRRGSIAPPSPPSGITSQPATRGISPPPASTSRRRPPPHMKSVASPSSLPQPSPPPRIDKALMPIVDAAFPRSAFFFLVVSHSSTFSLVISLKHTPWKKLSGNTHSPTHRPRKKEAIALQETPSSWSAVATSFSQPSRPHFIHYSNARFFLALVQTQTLIYTRIHSPL